MKLSELKSLWAECHLDDHERALKWEQEMSLGKYRSERHRLISLLDRATDEGWISNPAFDERWTARHGR